MTVDCPATDMSKIGEEIGGGLVGEEEDKDEEEGEDSLSLRGEKSEE